MKKKKIIFIMTGVLLTSAVFIGMLAFAAEYGTQNDPLVSLSYINSVFAPELKKQIGEEMSKQIGTVKNQVDSKISSYEAVVDGRIADFISNNAAFVANEDTINAVSEAVAQRIQYQGESSSAFVLQKISKGQTIVCSVGTEVLLRLGSSVCVSTGTPGIIDMTDGKDLPDGQPMMKNHLYLCTVEGRGVKATTAATVLIRGNYTIQ